MLKPITRIVGRGLLCALAIALLLFSPASPARARTSPAIDVQAVDAYLRAQVKGNRLPGLAVTVVQGGRVAFLQGYGKAAPGRPVTPQTQFYLGSVSKSFTALAVMQLVEEGKLELDAPVQRYLPSFCVADAQASGRITVRHLLNQTSGLSPAGDPGAADYAPTLAEEVRSLQKAHLTAPVGGTFQYFNQNYRVLGLLIEQVSGQPYGDYLRTHILSPLAMGHTVTGPADAPALAQGHGQAFGFSLPRPQAFQPAALPSGYIISSAEDMGHYLLALLDGARYEGRQVVQPATLAQMFTPPAGTGSSYGMGWMATETTEGERVLYHDGALENYYSMVMLFPERDLGFCLLINRNSLFQQIAAASPLAVGLANVLVGDPPPPARLPAWLPFLLIPLAAADLLNHLRLFRQLPRWAAQPRARRWLQALVEVLFALALLGLPVIAGAVKGEGANWAEMYGLFPDVTGWILAGAALDLARGVAGMILMARRKALSVAA